MKISKKEKDILDAVEGGEWSTIPNFEQERKRYQECAEATFRKNKRLSIRISEKDFADIQKRALQEGVPYHTLISSVLHKFASGRFVEKSL